MKSYTEKEINNALDELQKRTAGLEGHELRAALTQFHSHPSRRVRSKMGNRLPHCQHRHRLFRHTVSATKNLAGLV